MQRISVYISDDTKQRIDLAARAKSKVEAELIREALDAGLDFIYPESSSADGLINFAEQAEKIPTKGKVPNDLIENMDYYTWGGRKGE